MVTVTSIVLWLVRVILVTCALTHSHARTLEPDDASQDATEPLSSVVAAHVADQAEVIAVMEQSAAYAYDMTAVHHFLQNARRYRGVSDAGLQAEATRLREEVDKTETVQAEQIKRETAEHGIDRAFSEDVVKALAEPDADDRLRALRAIDEKWRATASEYEADDPRDHRAQYIRNLLGRSRELLNRADASAVWNGMRAYAHGATGPIRPITSAIFLESLRTQLEAVQLGADALEARIREFEADQMRLPSEENLRRQRASEIQRGMVERAPKVIEALNQRVARHASDAQAAGITIQSPQTIRSAGDGWLISGGPLAPGEQITVTLDTTTYQAPPAYAWPIGDAGAKAWRAESVGMIIFESAQGLRLTITPMGTPPGPNHVPGPPSVRNYADAARAVAIAFGL